MSKAAKKDLTPSLNRLVKFVELDPFQRDSEYIRTGYRRRNDSYVACLQSLFYWSNESVNIWTHLLAAIFFAVLALAPFSSHLTALLSQSQYYVDPFDSNSPMDARAFYVFFAGAIFLFSASASFHCFSCHSPGVCHFCNRADHLGIVILIVTSFVPAVYYGFYCHPHLQTIYLLMITAFGTFAAYTVVNPVYRQPDYRRIRAWIFICLGSSAVFPVIHCVLLEGLEKARTAFALDWLLSEGVFYIGGALLYAERVPEKYAPGKYDLLGSSHQIFHVCVNIAAVCHYIGLTKMFKYTQKTSC